MEKMLEQQQCIGEAIKKLEINMRKEPFDRRTPDLIKRRLDTLEMYWLEFNTNNSQLTEKLESNHEYFAYNFYDDIKKIYVRAKELLESWYIIKPATPINVSGTPRATNEDQPKTSTIPLPTVTVPGVQTLYQEKSTDSKQDEFIRKQTSNFKAFARTLSHIKVEKMSDKWEFEDALRTIESRWQVIDKLHWEFDSEYDGSNQEYENMYTKNEESYYNIKKTINSKLWSVQHREKATPQLDIPFFHGNYQQWVSFRDLFCEAVHNNPTLSSAQKMQFLKSKLKGEPERLIQHLQISSDNYKASWDILNHRYTNKKLIFTSHMNILMSLPTIQQDKVSSNQIKKIHDVTTECLNAIKNLGVNIETWDPILIHFLSQKLDAETHNDYLSSLAEPRELPKLEEFLSFLENKFTTMESSRRKQETHFSKPSTSTAFPARAEKYSQHKQVYANNKIATSPNSKTSRIAKLNCSFCQSSEHSIYCCKEFNDLPPAQRRQAIMKLRICCNCLYQHYDKTCTSRKRCRECGGCHNTMLHEAYVSKNNLSNVAMRLERASVNEPSTSHHITGGMLTEILLATAMIKVLGKDGKFHILRALIDQGSQISLLTENAARKLCLSRQKCNGAISGVGAKEVLCKGKTSIKCLSITEKYSFEMEVYIMTTLTRNLPNKSFGKPSWEYLTNLQLADPEFYTSRPIDILLGADVYSQIILEGVKRSIQAKPIAQQTRLGWILCGKAEIFQCNFIYNEMTDIRHFWEIEDIGESSQLSSEDQECIEFFNKTTIRLGNGSYQVRLPLTANISDIGQSRSAAVAQFLQLERRFAKNKSIETEYKQFINEYLAMGHMTPSRRTYALEYFFPHHCVIREDSTTTALRVVFNASQRTSNGSSLNDFMKKGPNLQKDLLSLILKWRQYRVAYTADVEKMFRMIHVHHEDQGLQKIVWRNNPSENIQEYQLTTIPFGIKAAPFLAMMTMRRLAEDERHKYPKAAKVIAESFYMDDLIHGSHDAESAIQMKQNLIKLLKSGGFNLRKWSSNYQVLLKESDEFKKQEHYDFNQSKTTKALGIHWIPEQDVFTFQSKINDDEISKNIESSITKRKLLSCISKLFDPIGLLTPISTQLKTLFQKVWKTNIQWDDKIPQDIHEAWQKINQDLKCIQHIIIPRWLGTSTNTAIELHGFSDASKVSYACVIYCKLFDRELNTTKITIVAGKSKVTPCNKEVTLPKLELCGAHLLTKLMKKVVQNLSSHQIQVYGWTDSTAVLGWIQGDPNRWKVFVSNRVRQITEVIPPHNWQHVKSSDNPADCASRGLLASQLQHHTLWWKGPSWLPTFIATQKQDTIFTTSEETIERKTATVAIQESVTEANIITDMINKYSSWNKVVKVLAWIRRFITAKRNNHREKHLSLAEIRGAKNLIIKKIQDQEYNEEINHIQKSKHISLKSKIANLHPYLDQEGVLRVGGRLKHANISPEMKNPIILPYNSKLTELIIRHAHLLTYHGGARVTLAFVRRKYWIPQGNRLTKKLIRQCVICKRQKPQLQEQIMGDLPPSRVNPSRPFKHTAVDNTGFISVKANKGRGIKTTKGYVTVFVCMVTKAVHLELVSDLTTSAFLAALRRMVARRGAPTDMYSDNGRNFVGANRTLQQEYQAIHNVFKDEGILNEITDMEITWHHNAASWSSAGGIFESAVKSFKHHFKRVVGDQALTFEEYSTVLSQIEACLNSRPLCALTEDPEDLNYLTPAHFLSGGPLLTIIETERDLRTRWKMTQQIVQDIWKRWKAEYLTQLFQRCKWKQPKDNVNKNDIVIIHDDNLPPGKWRMGRIVELHPGQDGFVRVVTLRTKDGYIKRPVTKISFLQQSKDANNMEKSFNHQSANHVHISPKKPRLNFVSFITAFLFLLTLVTNAECQNVTKFRDNDNQSLYFDKIGDMKLMKNEWKLIIYYNMKPYWQGNKALREYTESLERTCQTLRDKSHCKAILDQLIHGCLEIGYYNELLTSKQDNVRSSPENHRTRRGLVNGIGYIASELFGVLDERFAEQYKQDIESLQEDHTHVITLWKKQTSIIEAQNSMLKSTEKLMDSQNKMLKGHLTDIEDTMAKLSKELQTSADLSNFAIAFTLANNLLTNIKDIQKTLITTLTASYQGSINLHLLTPEQLIVELNKISSQIPKDESLPVDNFNSDIKDIYSLLKVKSRIKEEYLIFEIKIPLISRDSYEILKIYQVPKSRGGKMYSVVPVAEYISINMRQDKYIKMTEIDVRHCSIQADTYFCQSQKPVYHFKENKNLCQTERSDCKTETKTCIDTWHETHALNTYLFFCCRTCNVRSVCEDQMTSLVISEAGLITIGHGCIIKTDQLAIYPHRLHSSDFKITPDVYLPKNAPINNIINITIPHLLWPENQTSGNNEKHIEIDNMITSLKNQESEATGRKISYHDIHHYAMIYILMGIVGVIIIVYLVRQCQSRNTPPTPNTRITFAAPTPATAQAPPPPPAAAPDHQLDQDIELRAIPRVHRRGIGTSPLYRKSFYNVSD